MSPLIFPVLHVIAARRSLYAHSCMCTCSHTHTHSRTHTQPHTTTTTITTTTRLHHHHEYSCCRLAGQGRGRQVRIRREVHPSRARRGRLPGAHVHAPTVGRAANRGGATAMLLAKERDSQVDWSHQAGQRGAAASEQRALAAVGFNGWQGQALGVLRKATSAAYVQHTSTLFHQSRRHMLFSLL
jgi:hypothetical protein